MLLIRSGIRTETGDVTISRLTVYSLSNQQCQWIRCVQITDWTIALDRDPPTCPLDGHS